MVCGGALLLFAFFSPWLFLAYYGGVILLRRKSGKEEAGVCTGGKSFLTRRREGGELVSSLFLCFSIHVVPSGHCRQSVTCLKKFFSVKKSYPVGKWWWWEGESCFAFASIAGDLRLVKTRRGTKKRIREKCVGGGGGKA